MIQLYNKMDTNKSGFLLESNFKSYLESQGLSEDEIGNKAIKYFSECDKDHSGVVSIQEFLEWGQDRSFQEFISLTDGSMTKSFEGESTSNYVAPSFNESQESKAQPIKQRALERRITNKFKSNLADKIKGFNTKKKTQDLSSIFQSLEFKAACKDIKNLCLWNTGVKKISPLDLIRAMKPIVPYFPDGVSKSEFISLVFSLDVDSD